MKSLLICSLAALGLMLGSSARSALAHDQYHYYEQATFLPWHGAYADQTYGVPLALVVPPTCAYQTQMGWGVCGHRVVPIYHQYARPYPGEPGFVGAGFLPQPAWPSDTTQFGVYYIRGPW